MTDAERIAELEQAARDYGAAILAAEVAAVNDLDEDDALARAILRRSAARRRIEAVCRRLAGG